MNKETTDIRILNLIRRKGPMTTSQIAATLGISRARINNQIIVLRKENRIHRSDWQLNPGKPDAAIFDIGNFKDAPKLTKEQKIVALRKTAVVPAKPKAPIHRDESVVAFFGHYEKGE